MSKQDENDGDGSGSDTGNWKPTATVTLPDGETTQTADFSVTSANISVDSDDVAMDTVSIGLQDDDREYDFQASLEVPTKTLVCVNCSHPNTVPVWAFAHVEFNGGLEPLSGDYAVGHQCVQCGFPY